MDILVAIALGIIQGITEWLPISSSGHLAIAQEAFGVEPPIFFDVMLHLGSLVVVFWLFRKDIVVLLRSFLKLLKLLPKPAELNRELEEDVQLKLISYLLLGSIPIYVTGLIVYFLFLDQVKSLPSVGAALILTSLILLTTRNKDGHKKEKEIGWKDALFVGIAQSLAILPGVSRSGSTISGSLDREFDREFAFRFSFLLFIPAMLGAAVFQGLDVLENGIENDLILPTIVGTVTSMIVGYLSIQLLHEIIKKRLLHYFSPYCFLLGSGILVYFFFF